MPSIIPGYEYDIFISYRQKDNKGDRWVSEFVDALKTELESTFKEEISVYFDINPHDGLLETHDVDASLKDKLKCLVFIPIISRTYCDPKSFAWEHELKAFVEQATQDQFGLKIKVPNGNVSNRVLPVRIHDLDNEDIKLCESVLGGVLRGIEFIYKESGFNRPIKPDDDEKINLNKTKYRNQITKVTLAVKEIISGLKTGTDSKVTDRSKIASEEGPTDDSGRGKVKNGLISTNLKKWLIISFALFLCIAGSIGIYKMISHGKQSKLSELDKSIAVLPFVNDSPDKENEYFCNGMMEEILNQLQKIGDLKVKARTSVEKYRNPDKDIKVIGHELGVSFIMEGSVRKVGDNIRITAQLINTKTGNHLWSETYDWKYTTEIFKYQSSVAKKVAASLNAVITPAEEKRVDKKPTMEMAAYDLCLRAGEMTSKFQHTGDTTYIKLALNLFNQALKVDPEYIGVIGGKALLYREAQIFDSAMFYSRRIYELDPMSNPGAIGLTYLYMNKPDSAYKYLTKAVDLAPNDAWLNLAMGQVLLQYLNEPVKGLKYYQNAYDFMDVSDASLNGQIAWAFELIGDYSKAGKYVYKALSQSSECYFIYQYDYLLIGQGKYDEALHFLDSTCSVNPCEPICDITRFIIYASKKDFQEAEKYYNKNTIPQNFRNGVPDIYIAYLYKETDRKKEAFSILNDLIKVNEGWLKNTIGGIDMMWYKLDLAAAYALLDENEKALQYLRELEKLGTIEGAFNLKTFPGFDNLRNDPEFKAIVKSIEDKRAAIREKVKEMEQRGEINL